MRVNLRHIWAAIVLAALVTHLERDLFTVRSAKRLLKVLLRSHLPLGHIQKDILNLHNFIQVLFHSAPPLANLVLVAGNLEALPAFAQSHH